MFNKHCILHPVHVRVPYFFISTPIVDSATLLRGKSRGHVLPKKSSCSKDVSF